MMTIDSTSFWIITGIVLIIGEMVSMSFFLLFIALGAFAAALAASFGQSHVVQGLTCAGVSVIGVLALRKPIQHRLLKSMNVATDVGTEITVDQAIAPHQQARISYQGTSWLATNLGATAFRVGERVIIVGIDGNTLLLRKVN